MRKCLLLCSLYFSRVLNPMNVRLVLDFYPGFVMTLAILIA